MEQEAPYWVLAYYHLIFIEDPQKEVALQHDFFQNRDVKSRIYISQEGINAQMSASRQSAEEYMDWMKSRFEGISFKIHCSQEHAFPKTTVKIRKQLVAMDCSLDLNKRGVHLSPQEWNQMLEEKKDEILLIDVRNDYEWKVGHFEDAELPPCETFREFPAYFRSLKEKHDPKKTPVMMYCTGGIRCEYASSFLLQEGFEEVYQLKGGVIDYGLQEGAKHWKGKLFVFDDRLVVPISEEEPAPISCCSYCSTPNDVYYNCANMDCNKLFICCITCLHQHKGCCCSSCIEAKRVRPYHSDGSAKPFRKITLSY